MRIPKLHRRFKLLRRFRRDLMGYLIIRPSIDNKYSNYLVKLILSTRKTWWERTKRYIYRLDIVNPEKRVKRVKRWFVTRQLMLFTYPYLSFKQFRTLNEKAMRTEGSIESTFIRYLEGTVIGMLYRMQVYSNVFDLHKFVRFGGAGVSTRMETYPKRVIGFGEIFRIIVSDNSYVRLNLLIRVYLRRCRFNTPRYLYVNYKLLIGFMFRDATVKDVVHRFSDVDIYRGADLAQ